MVKVKIPRRIVVSHVVPSFECESCAREEAFYTQMPTACWWCGFPFRYDIGELLRSQIEREIFHFNKATSEKLLKGLENDKV